MDSNTEQALMGLLGDMVQAIKGLREDIKTIHQDVKWVRENQLSYATKLDDLVKNMASTTTSENIPTSSKPKAKTRKKKEEPKPTKSERAPSAIELKVWDLLKDEYDEGIACPTITANGTEFIVNGVVIQHPLIEATMKRFLEDDGATPADIAAEVGVSVEAAYFIHVMMEAKK